MGIADAIAGLAQQAATGLSGALFPPQALAEETPMMADGFWYGENTLELIDRTVTYQQLYRVQPAVTAVVNKRADLLATLPRRVWDNAAEHGRKEMPATDQLVQLLRDPVPGYMDGFSFWRWFAATRDICGEAYAVKKRRADGSVFALQPMTPVRTRVKRNGAGEVTYLFTVGGATGVTEYPARDVLTWANYNPAGTMRGMSMLEPLRLTLANEDAARRANVSFWKRGARPATVITRKDAVSAAALEKIRRQFDRLHAGVDNVGSTAVLDEGMDVKTLQLSLEEMQYLESRKLNLGEVCMVFDVPPAAIHALLEKSSFSSTTEQMRSLGRDTMPPICESLASAINSQLVPDFYGDADPGRYEVEFGLDELLRGDWEKLAQLIPGLVQGGVTTPNDVRPLLGLPVVDDEAADALYANQATVPLGSSPVQPAAPSTYSGAPSADSEADAPTKSISRHVKGLSGTIQGKASRSDARNVIASQQRKALQGAMQRQTSAISGAWDSYGDLGDDIDPEDLAGDLYDPDDWDDDLAGDLLDPTTAAVDAFGRRVAGHSFDVGRAEEWIKNNVGLAAAFMNGSTQDRLKTVLGAAFENAGEDNPLADLVGDAIEQLADYMLGARLDQAAESRATSLAGFGEHEGATQAGMATKTWVTGANARDSHAMLDGETVGLDEEFSSGARWPGDTANLPIEDVAGCNCSLDFG